MGRQPLQLQTPSSCNDMRRYNLNANYLGIANSRTDHHRTSPAASCLLELRGKHLGARTGLILQHQAPRIALFFAAGTRKRELDLRHEETWQQTAQSRSPFLLWWTGCLFRLFPRTVPTWGVVLYSFARVRRNLRTVKRKLDFVDLGFRSFRVDCTQAFLSSVFVIHTAAERTAGSATAWTQLCHTFKTKTPNKFLAESEQDRGSATGTACGLVPRCRSAPACSFPCP